MTADTLCRALGARRAGSQWMAKCPAHDDHNPSLAIKEVDGKILLRCHAGCEQSDVIEALKARGLWEQEDNSEQPVIVAEYNYVDEKGELLYQVVRYRPKNFKQRHPDGHGGWIWKKHPRQVLYRLPEIPEAPIVFLVEGEKDVDTLREFGFTATTNAGGAKAKWLPSFTQTLSGREVILIPDRDQPGRQRVLQIARALLEHASRIVVFEPEDAKDITEWFERGHSELELISIIDPEVVSQ